MTTLPHSTHPALHILPFGAPGSGRTTVTFAVQAVAALRRGDTPKLGKSLDTQIVGNGWLASPRASRYLLRLGNDQPHAEVRGTLRRAIRGGGGVLHSGYDTIGLLIVSAADGSSADTAEQVRLAVLAGVERFIICVTHADAAEPAWADFVEADARRLLAEVGVPADEVPALRGDFAAAYGDPASPDARPASELLDLLDGVPLPTHERPFRMTIVTAAPCDEGVLVTGVPAAGCVSLGDAVEVVGGDLPPCPATVAGLEMYGRPVADLGWPGPASMRLASIDPSVVTPGRAVIAPGRFVPCRMLDVALVTADRPFGRLRIGARLRVIAADEYPATVRGLWRPDGSATDEVGPGECARASVELAVSAVFGPRDRLELADEFGFRPAEGSVRSVSGG